MPRYRSNSSFGFGPLSFREVMALGLGKCNKMSVFCTFVVPLTGFAVSDRTLQIKINFVMLELYTAGRGLGIACNTLMAGCVS
jgi:hypothetical protein